MQTEPTTDRETLRQRAWEPYIDALRRGAAKEEIDEAFDQAMRDLGPLYEGEEE